MKRRKWLIGLTVLCVSALMGFVGCFDFGNGNKDGSNTNNKKATTGLQYQKISGKEEYRVIGIGEATDVDIIIPSAHNGLPVTEIAEKAFAVMQNSIAQNYYIKSVTVPYSVKLIDKEAFSDCDNLTSVTVNGGEIGKGAFSDCDNLTSVTLGINVTAIGNEAFSMCTALKNIIIPNKVTSIGEEAFYHCRGLTSVVIGSGVNTIGDEAFAFSSELKSVEIGSGTIGKKVFLGCTNLTSVMLGENVTAIGDEAFSNCVGIKSLVIPDKVIAIGESAFYSCEGLTSVVIGSEVKKIDDYAFGFSYAITSIRFNGTTVQWASVSKGDDWAYGVDTKTVACSNGSVAIK